MNAKEKGVFESLLRQHIVLEELRDWYRERMKQAGENEPDHETAKRILERATDPERKWDGQGKKKTDNPAFTEIHVPLKKSGQ